MVLYPGDVVFIKFPFSDSKGYKKRPALVLQKFGDGDLIVCRITSKGYSTQYDVIVDDWEKYGLLLPSTIRVHKLIAVESSLIDQKLGAVSSAIFEKVTLAFCSILVLPRP